MSNATEYQYDYPSDIDQAELRYLRNRSAALADYYVETLRLGWTSDRIMLVSLYIPTALVACVGNVNTPTPLLFNTAAL